MPTASAYLDRLAEILEQHLGPFAAGPDCTINAQDTAGTLDGVISFADGCELHVNAVVDPDTDPLVPLAIYRFHCQDVDKRCVVRFDNAPHHRHLPTFPLLSH